MPFTEWIWMRGIPNLMTKVVGITQYLGGKLLEQMIRLLDGYEGDPRK